MAHETRVDGRVFDLAKVADIGRTGERTLLRVHRNMHGGAVAIANGHMMRDGIPLLGNLTTIDWGESALLRVGRTRIEVVWRDVEERHAAAASERCRICFGSFTAEEMAVVCRCSCVFHEECDRVRVDCPGCGAPQGHGAR